MLQQQQLGSSLSPAGSKRFHPSHFSGVYGSKTPCFSQHIDKKDVITSVYREEKKQSCPWEHWTELSCSLPAIACNWYLFTCKWKVCHFTLPLMDAGPCWIMLFNSLFGAVCLWFSTVLSWYMCTVRTMACQPRSDYNLSHTATN